MNPDEVKKQLRKLRDRANSQKFFLTILHFQVEALTQELADALARQHIDPGPFLDRLKKRSLASVKEIILEREKIKAGLKKRGYKDPLDE